MALMLTGLTTLFAAHAQSATAGLSPNVDLDASLSTAAPVQYTSPAVMLHAAPAPGEKLFDTPPAPEGGWKGLAKLLEAASPGVDTSIPLTPSQITDRIAAMMDEGQYALALDTIDKRMAQRQAEKAMGSDVQLLFLRGRALAGLERHEKAIEHYLSMTALYPELPEPWNNLAVEYAKLGRLEMAYNALQMALAASPNYSAAHANLGWIQLMQARRSFENAPALPSAGRAAQQTTDILNR